MRSMDKLFDLMVMGVKYQLHCASRLDQILEVCTREREVCCAMVTLSTSKFGASRRVFFFACVNSDYVVCVYNKGICRMWTCVPDKGRSGRQV